MFKVVSEKEGLRVHDDVDRVLGGGTQQTAGDRVAYYGRGCR